MATTNNRIRIPRRKLLQQHVDAAAEIGATGLIVHGGHVLAADDPAVGFDNWRKTFERIELRLPVLIENTAGGDHAMARRLDGDRPGSGTPSTGTTSASASTPATPGPAGSSSLDAVDRVKAITGRVDLVHANDSKDGFDSGRDRHDNFGQGSIDPAELVAVVAAAGAPVVCETPGGAEGQGGRHRLPSSASAGLAGHL